jgi:Tol biopolymer transport system component/tRNA A-37 threonylcarbamoyl transferase component Bud32
MMAMLAESDFSNTTIRRFDIQRLIASGGMGEVYVARDAVLGRDLALKILRQDVTWDANRLERFVQEARAASALNHPHLISIYDIGESAPKRNGVAQGPPVLYIAMELVAGETLRKAIESRRLDAKRALEYLVQVADALGAAHAAGVIHRDLKPENLMIADGGYAKVLDFGIAKLRADLAPPRADSDIAPSAGVMGTVGYMSPEQVQGQPLDPRTDVFSFGCVLYETITGRRAFQGKTSFETLKRILSEEPEPITEPLPHVQLQPVIRRCLAKNPDHRYQSMQELSRDLRGLLRRLEAATHREAHERVPWTRLLAGGAGIIALVVAIWWTTEGRFLGRTPTNVGIQRLTLSGTAIDAATSRDGRYLAWVESIGGMQGLRVRQIGEDRSIELVPPAPVGYWGIAFSSDASRVFYATKSAQEPAGRLYVVSVLGGTPRALVNGIDSTITLSPDGRQFAFYRASFPERGSSSLLVANVENGNPRVLATARGQQFFVPAFFAAPSWSPDGERIAAAIHDAKTGDAGLVTVDVASGKIDPFPERFKDATFTAWLPDGSGILFVADQVDALKDIPRKVWLQPYPRGEPRRVTPDLLEYRNISVRGDGAFVSVGLDAVYSLWRLPLNGQAPQRIASERYDGLLGIAPLKDGRFVMSTGERGNSQLAIVDRTGGSRETLTREGTNTWPAVSPDDRTIVFVSNRDGQTGVWRMNVDGTEPKLLAHLPRPSWLSVTPDGQNVVCASLDDAEPATWRVPIDGGQPTLIAAGIDRPAVSPDGRFLAGINVASNAGQLALVTMPLDGSGPPRVLGAIAPATANGLVEWTARGDGILYSTVERANVWLQRLSGGPPIQVTNLNDLAIVRGKRTVDGDSLIVARGVAQTDAYLVSNFR